MIIKREVSRVFNWYTDIVKVCEKLFDEFLPNASPSGKAKTKKPFFGQTNETFASVNDKLSKEV